MFLMIGSKVERKRCALTWHYRNADPEYGVWQARELQTHLEQAIIPKHAIEILTGKANLEVRPRDINKGEIVCRLIGQHAENLDFVFCAGDDKTDEGGFARDLKLTVDMFRQLRKANGIPNDDLFPTTVGAATKMTSAKWHVLEPMDIIDAMAKLAGTEN
jgi:trehalose 6-phosphate synthase/phosphatase